MQPGTARARFRCLAERATPNRCQLALHSFSSAFTVRSKRSSQKALQAKRRPVPDALVAAPLGSLTKIGAPFSEIGRGVKTL